MVMAAGLGTRMRPLTNDRPKALVTVAGKALLDHMLDRLAEDGVERVVVNVHHFADLMEAHLAVRPQPPQVVISDERAQLLETGGALVKARALLGEEPIFVANADPVWREDPGSTPTLASLRSQWDPARSDAVLLLAPRERTLGYDGRGDFHRDADGAIRRRGEAPRADYVYAGVQVLAPSLIDGFALEPFSLNRMWDKALAAGRVHGVVLQGEWMHVGDPAAREAAENRLRELETAQ